MCSKIIQKGEQYRILTWFFDTKFGEDKQCLDCVKLIDWYCEKSGEGEYAYEDVMQFIYDDVCCKCDMHYKCEKDNIEKCESVIQEVIRNENSNT